MCRALAGSSSSARLLVQEGGRGGAWASRAEDEEGGGSERVIKKGRGLEARMAAALIKVLERRGMRTRCAMNASGVGRIDGRWRPLCVKRMDQPMPLTALRLPRLVLSCTTRS